MEFSKIVDKDITVVDFKLRMRIMWVFISKKNSILKTIFFGLEFLGEEINKTKFK